MLDGIQATQAMRGLVEIAGKYTPFVAMAAHALHAGREVCLAVEMDGYLSRPLDARMLLQTVERLADSRPGRDASVSSIVKESGRWSFRNAKQCTQ